MIPNVPATISGTTARNHVWSMLAIGIMVDLLARVDPLTNVGTKGVAHATRVATHEVNVVGWATLFVFMTLLTDMDSTAVLAEMFALLIMLSALFLHGKAAFTNLQNFISPKAVPSRDPNGGT